MITEPIDRFNRINNLIESFAKANQLSAWQMRVQENFTSVGAKQLYHPKILDPRNQERSWQDYEGKKFPHSQPLKLLKDQWSIVYGSREYEQANILYENLQKASNIFGVKVEEPQWVEVPDGKTAQQYNECIRSDVNPKTCQIVCVILFKPELKKYIKSFLDEGGVPSQFITAKKLGGKLSLGVFSNLLKQMNAKVKLDLYSVNLPLFRKTMLIGIDVIMQGNAKLIGCCATYNQQMT